MIVARDRIVNETERSWQAGDNNKRQHEYASYAIN